MNKQPNTSDNPLIVLDPEAVDIPIEENDPRTCFTCSWAANSTCCQTATRCTREDNPSDEAVVAEWLDTWRQPVADCLVGMFRALFGRPLPRLDPPNNASDCPGYAPRTL